MLILDVGGTDLFNEITGEFIEAPATRIYLEHSLYSISKWESEFRKPFISKIQKTDEEVAFYIRCMLTNEVDETTLLSLTPDDYKKIDDYINTDRTATWFSNPAKGTGGNSGRQITSELIYYWMTAYSIPVEFEHWHLSRLIALIKICDAENKPKQKMSKEEVYASNRALNEANRKRFKSKG